MIALGKLLFLLHGSWPSTRHWATQELQLLCVPGNLLKAIEQTVAVPDATALDSLLEEVHRYLEQLGETFHQDMQALNRWAFLTEEGKIAFQTWGAR